MNVKKTIEKRRAYRSLDPVNITEDIVEDLARAAQLSPSCFNNQPWRYVFVYEQEALNNVKAALSRGNAWAKNASMIIAVFSKEEDDCIINDRVYNLFDTGMATGFLMLRATELGLVCHPIAGYKPDIVREALNIPDGHKIITLLNVGKHAGDIKPELSEHQVESEGERPERLPLAAFVHKNKYIEPQGPGEEE